MFEYKQLGYLDDTLKLQSLFAFLCIDLDMTDSAVSASERIFNACGRLFENGNVDVYASARQSSLVAEVAIYAMARDAERVFTVALGQYIGLRARFKERYPDLRFTGDFESAEGDLLEGGAHLLLDSHAQRFRSVVRAEHVRSFFQILDQGASPE